MVCTFEYYTFENLSSSSFKSLNFFEGQCKSTLLTRGKNSRKIYPHFPLKVFQIEFIISLFYHLTLFPTGFFFFFFIPHWFLYFCLHCFPNYSNFKISSDALFSPTTNFIYLFTAMSFLSTPFLQPHCSSLTLPPFILYLLLFHSLPIG